ncbi:hypothetical protein [Methanobacterium sp.]|uniref:hypothetical protein n=1 Tax=Methanobacterium sp. TaxID=2164 RepID=UPI003C775D8A
MESLNLTPAESMMIISPKASGDKMIKFTLMDLLLKKSLKLDIDDNFKFLKRSQGSIIISEGESCEWLYKPHEEILMELILEHHELKLDEFVDTLYKKIGSPIEYKTRYVRDPLVDKGYFKKQKKMLLSLAPYTIYSLTDNGLKVKSKITELLDQAEYLEKWMKEDLGKAKAYLSVLGSHILLTNVYDIEDIKKFNRVLSYINPESHTSEYYDYYLYNVPIDYLDDYGNLKSFDFLDIYLLDHFNSFDDFLADFKEISVSRNRRVERRIKNKDVIL